MGKILKVLREEKYNLLLSVFEEFIEYSLKENNLEISFNKSLENILLKQQNIDIINNIIKEYDLKISFKFIEQVNESNLEELLKQKFKTINIKE